MVVALRQSSTSGPNDTQTNPRVIGKPTGTLTDDIVIAGIEFWSVNNSAITVNSATPGFTEFLSVGPISGGGGFIWLKLFYKRVLAGEAASWSFAFTGGSGVWSLGQAKSISGAITTGNPVETSNSASGSGTAEPTSAVTIATLAFLSHWASRADSGTQSNPPTSFTMLQNGNVLACNYLIPGATGTYSATGGVISPTSSQITALVAIKPASTGTTGTIAGTLPEITGALAATAKGSGVIAGTLPSPTAAIAGVGTATGALAGALPTLAAALAGTAVGSGPLVGSLPEALGALVGTAASAGAFTGTLPAVTGALTGEANTAGTLAGVLPALIADVDVVALAAGALVGGMPTLAATLTGFVDTSESLLLGVLPAMQGNLAANARSNGALVEFIPALQAGLVGGAATSGTLAGALPELIGDLGGLAYTAGVGVLTVILPAMVAITGKGQWVNELEAQRRITRDFIMASPVVIALFPNAEQRKPSGAVILVKGVSRPQQQFRLIPMGHTERPVRGEGGEQRKYDMTLLGEWDAVVRENDYWIDEASGQHYVVDALVPFNGYQVKALIMSYGRRGSTV